MSITIIMYVLGAISGFFNKKIGYIIAAIASLISITLSLEAMFAGYHWLVLQGLFDSATVGLRLDKISGIFLFISSISFFAVSIFSIDFDQHYSKRMSIFLNLDMLGMVIILLANDGIVFLTGWEIMTITSFLLIVESKNAYKEAFKFLAFSELSTVALLIAFIDLYAKTGSFDLKGRHDLLFIFFTSLAFFVKMGIVPFHTWLKEAHAKAPSNVSALLSAPITLMGVYGLVRITSTTCCIHAWGVIAVVFGSLTAFYGAISSAASKGLKVLPAYSTVENNGMILAMLGFAAISKVLSHATLSEFAFLTVIFLSVAHTISKTLLFLSIGQAKEQLGEDSIDNVRGIHRSVGKIPAAGILFAGLSFSAFPGLIGYVAEWMMLESIFQSYHFMSLTDRVVSSTAGVLLSLAAGFAAFAMIKLIGYTALGYHHEKKAKPMRVFSMNIAEVFLILLIGVFSIFATKFMYLVGYKNLVIGALGVPHGWLIASAKPVFGVVSPAFLWLVVSVLFIIPFFIYLSSLKTTKRVTSWNGGLNLKEEEYFTANAFSFIIEHILRFVYRTKEIQETSSAYVSIIDVFDKVYTRLALFVSYACFKVSRVIMNSRLHWYITYMLVMFLLVFVLFG